jgi:serine/threonine-protein kinase PknK
VNGPPPDDLELPGYGPAVLLTQGGYSHIYRVHQPQFDRSVAVKVLAFALTDYKAQRRFQRECRLAGRLSAHPNIVTVHDAGIAPDGRPYITMEFFPAGSIADRIHRDGPFKVSDALRIGIACAGALETAHRAGVIHRDVKPANVLLTSYGQPALADFGLSVLAERQAVTAGADALTPYHAPPEMLERSAATARSDVYSLASSVYTMLAGHAPHQGAADVSPAPTVGELLLSILQQDVPPMGRPDIPKSLEAALGDALARDPSERTPTALAFAHALQEVQLQLGYEVTDPVVIDVDTGASAVGAAGVTGESASGSLGSPSPAASPGIVTDGNPLDDVYGPDPAGGGLDTGLDTALGTGGPGGPGGSGGGGSTGIGETTVERFATFAPLPKPLTRLDDRPPRRAWVIPVAVGVVVVAGLAATLALRPGGSGDTDDDTALPASGRAEDERSDPAAGRLPADAEPHDISASESEAGVQLDWSGDPDGRHVVLMLSETAPPMLLDPVEDLSLLVPAPELRPGEGYCFAVARVDAIAGIPLDERIEPAFSAPACIRGASRNTVRTS